MRRWPRRAPPPCDSPHRPGGRRPPALGRGARRGAGVGEPGRWRCAPIGPRSLRRVLAGRDHGAGLPRRRHLREGSRGRTQRRVARVPPTRGGGVRRAAAHARVPAAARRLRRRRLGGAGLRGDRRRAAGASVGPAATAGRGAGARCPARRPHTQPRAGRARRCRQVAEPLRRLGRAGGAGPAPRRARHVERPTPGPPGRARVGVA